MLVLLSGCSGAVTDLGYEELADGGLASEQGHTLAYADQSGPPAPPAKPTGNSAIDAGAAAPDSSATPYTGPSGQPGSSCPCATGQVCVQGICRASCKKPTDGCGAVSSCPASESCLATVNGGLWVCVPGKAPGQACQTKGICYNKHVCGSIDSASYLCLPVCTKQGASCGAGGAGTCVKDTIGTCLFCSKP